MDELIDIVDESDNVTGSKMKSDAHKDGDRHRAAHVWIVKGSKIMLQKRSASKEFFPDRFDVPCAGHVKSGENYTDAAVRELKEELNIAADKNDLVCIDERKQVSVVKEKNLISREILKVFLLEHNSPDINFNRNEISEIRFFDISELRNMLTEEPELFVDDRKYFFDTIEKIEEFIGSRR